MEVGPVNGSEGMEKAAAGREAREAVGGSQRPAGSRTSEVKAVLMRYLTTEQYRERPGRKDRRPRG